MMGINLEQHFSYCKKFINAEADQSRYGVRYEEVFGQPENKVESTADKSEALVDTQAAAEIFKKRKENLKGELDGLLKYWHEHPQEKMVRKAVDLYQRVFYGEKKVFSDEERRDYFAKILALSPSRALSSVPLSPLESSDR